MAKSFKVYALIWTILLAVFCLVAFLVRPIIPDYVVVYDARFWIAFIFILIAFLGNLVCAYIAFQAQNLKKMFYNLPLITVSATALIVMLIGGCAVMLIPACPAWIAAVVCILILAFNAIAVIKAGWAGATVAAIDDKVKAQTSYIKNLTADAEGLVARAQSEPVKAECKKVYEAIRYSDPMSNETLSVIEAKITVKMDELAGAIGKDDADRVREIADEVVVLVGDRNRKCKGLK